MSDSVQPNGQQPTRLPHPWDSPGKNTGVGCHFLLQCMKVKNEKEVAQSCLTLFDPMDYSLPGPSIHWIFQARVLEWGAIAFSDACLYPLVILWCYSFATGSIKSPSPCFSSSLSSYQRVLFGLRKLHKLVFTPCSQSFGNTLIFFTTNGGLRHYLPYPLTTNIQKLVIHVDSF